MIHAYAFKMTQSEYINQNITESDLRVTFERLGMTGATGRGLVAVRSWWSY